MVLQPAMPYAVQAEVAEKERDARSAKKLQEIAGTAREEAAARAAKAAQEYERAFARANPGAAVMVSALPQEVPMHSVHNTELQIPKST